MVGVAGAGRIGWPGRRELPVTDAAATDSVGASGATPVSRMVAVTSSAVSVSASPSASTAALIVSVNVRLDCTPERSVVVTGISTNLSPAAMVVVPLAAV